MWKYILIIIFFLLTIREINLMNESLYVAPDTHQVVTEDKTLLSTVKHVIHKNIVKLENRIISKPKKEPQDNRTKKHPLPEKHEIPEKHPLPKKHEIPLPPVQKKISIEEVNQSTPKPPLPTKSKEQPLPNISTIESPRQQESTPHSPVVPQHTTKRPSLPTPKPHPLKPKTSVPPHVAAPHHLPAKSKVDPYKRAEERVNAILEEMKRQKER